MDIHHPELKGHVSECRIFDAFQNSIVVLLLKKEWIMWKEPNEIVELTKRLNEFREGYNTTRDHSALNYQAPKVVYYAEI